MILPRGRPVARRGLAHHLPRPRLHREKESARVDVVHEVPILGRELQQRPHAHHAGVVHQNVEPAEPLDGASDHRSALLWIAYVHLKRIRLRSEGLDLSSHGFGAGCVDVSYDDLCALARVAQRDCPPDPTAAPGNERYPSIQLPHVPLPLARRCGVIRPEATSPR